MSTIRNVRRLISHFSSSVVLPIDPDAVRDEILSYGIKDEIEFVGVDLDTRVIIGAFRQYIRRPSVYGEVIVCVDIYYDRSMTRDWRRVVCCKEILHMLDHSASKTVSQDDCENLVTHIVKLDPEEPFSPEKLQAWTDELMMLNAIAVLFPWDAREILYADYNEDETRLDAIIKAVDLPESVVRVVLSDRWPKLYQTIAGSN